MDMFEVYDLIVGAIAMASFVVGLFFLRFWRSSGDRFFLYFALSFFLEALHRIYMGTADSLREDSPSHYLIRLFAYGLILWAIIEKNWPRQRSKE